jgi:hypothetical protein
MVKQKHLQLYGLCHKLLKVKDNVAPCVYIFISVLDEGSWSASSAYQLTHKVTDDVDFRAGLDTAAKINLSCVAHNTPCTCSFPFNVISDILLKYFPASLYRKLNTLLQCSYFNCSESVLE